MARAPSRRNAINYSSSSARRHLKRYAKDVYHAALATSTWRQYSSQERCYKRWCKSFGIVAFPPRGGRMPVKSLCLYLADYLLRGYKTSSFKVILSSLKKAAEYRGVSWVDTNPLDKAYLDAMVRGGNNIRPPVPSRAKPLTLKLLHKLEEAKGKGEEEEQYVTMFWTTYGGLLRMKEVVNLRVGDAFWERKKKRVTLYIHGSKANKRGAPEKVTLYSAVDGGPSPYKSLKRYWDKRRLGRAPSASMRLFPMVAKRGRQAHYSRKEFVRAHLITYLRKQLTAVGVRNSKSYTGHSFRRGAATDLWKGGLDIQLIKKLGRWASDAVWLYIRTFPEKHQREVRAAFQQVRRSFK
jgi:integrase